MAKSARHTRLSIMEFHRMLPDVGPSGGDELPRGPSGDPGRADGTHKWISKWDGLPVVVSELPSADVPASALVVDTLDAFKEALDLVLDEYLNGFDPSEAARCILELRAPQFHFYILKRCVLRAMDEADRERELIAILFSALHARHILLPTDAAQGFHALLQAVDDLCIDTPAAAPLLAHFIADAVLDGIVPASAVAAWRAEFSSHPLASVVIEEADGRTGGALSYRGGGAAEAAAVRRDMAAVVEEYLCSGDVGEVRRRLRELNIPRALQHHFVRVCVTLAMERHDADRERVSQLLSKLDGNPLEQAEMAEGFEALLSRTDDLALDNPSAPSLLAGFLVRAIADDVLPPAFVAQIPPGGTPGHQRALEAARAQLSASHFGARRRHVWGKAATGRMVDLKIAVAELIQEYLASGEADEAVLCVKELNASPFHHEMVKQLVVAAMDQGPREREGALELLRRLRTEQVVSQEQLSLGCQRAVEAADDLKLDNPRAPEIIAEIVQQLGQK